MEKEQIEKVSAMRRMKTDVHKLRESVSNEIEHILKLKVSQDTAFWNVKEKLHQVEANHEKLKQNMVKLQMENEAISGQYQEELRFYPDVLNKLSSNRKISEVLEDCVVRLKDTVARCKTDHTSLCKAYNDAEEMVRELIQKNQQADEKHRQVINFLQDKVNMSSEHQKQFLELFASTKKQAEAEVADLKNKLETALSYKYELTTNINELRRNMDLCKFDVEKKEQTIANLQEDRKQLIQDFNKLDVEMNNILKKQEKDLKETIESNSSLKKALENEEQHSRNMQHRNNFLEEMMKNLEEEKSNLSADVCELRKQVQEITNANEKHIEQIAEITDEKNHLITENKLKEQSLIKEIEVLQQQITSLEREKDEMLLNLKTTIDDISMKYNNEIAMRDNDIQNLNKMIREMEDETKMQQELLNDKEKELAQTVEDLNKEIDLKMTTITNLMSEVKIMSDERVKLDTTIQNMKKEIEKEREELKEKEQKFNEKINKLENDIKRKDEVWSKQLSSVLENHKVETGRMQDKIQELEYTVDNIRHEVTVRRPAPRPVMPPELDDNAMASPLHANGPKPSSFPETNTDSLMYNIIIDNSVEKNEDSLDTLQVNRRFFAMSRGENLSPVAISSLKRRNVAAAAPGASAHGRSKPHHSDIQAKDNPNNIERKFFKTRKSNTKSKKTY